MGALRCDLFMHFESVFDVGPFTSQFSFTWKEHSRFSQRVIQPARGKTSEKCESYILHLLIWQTLLSKAT